MTKLWSAIIATACLVPGPAHANDCSLGTRIAVAGKIDAYRIYYTDSTKKTVSFAAAMLSEPSTCAVTAVKIPAGLALNGKIASNCKVKSRLGAAGKFGIEAGIKFIAISSESDVTSCTYDSK